MLYSGYFRLFQGVGRLGGRVVRWVGGKAEIITNSAQLGLELGMSLAKTQQCISDPHSRVKIEVPKHGQVLLHILLSLN